MGCSNTSQQIHPFKAAKNLMQTCDFGVLLKKSDFIKENKGEFKTFYMLGTLLGKGAYGEVRKCKARAGGEVKAVKIISKSMIEECKRASLVNEIEVLRQLDHPNIIRIHEFFQDSRYYYIVTELLTGGELFDKIVKKKILGEKDALVYMKQILSAVAYCHARHIVHRDIKPENILLENNEENSPIKIIDFGTSQCYDPEKKMRSKQGTAYYVAPEVLKKNYNEKCDVWSCGIILYILLTGRPPFNGKTDKEIIDQVESGIINYDTHELRKVSKEARSLLKAMTDYYPSKRISSVNALNHIWFSKEIKQSSELKSTVNVMQNLQEFRSHTKMEQAVYMYITTHLISNKEKTELRVVFESMDTNHDGQLSKDELIEGYTKISNNRLEAEAIVEDILQTADPDGNGFIDYTEFLVATANKKNMLSDEKLKATFDMFDQDKSGFITPEEVKCILGFGKQISESAWTDIVKQVDENGDGKISYEEFKEMMMKFME